MALTIEIIIDYLLKGQLGTALLLKVLITSEMKTLDCINVALVFVNHRTLSCIDWFLCSYDLCDTHGN